MSGKPDDPISVAVIAAPMSEFAEEFTRLLSSKGVDAQLIRSQPLSFDENKEYRNVRWNGLDKNQTNAVVFLIDEQLISVGSWLRISEYVANLSIPTFGFCSVRIADASSFVIGDVVYMLDYSSTERAVHELCLRIDNAITESQKESESTYQQSEAYRCIFTDAGKSEIAEYPITPDLASLLLKAQQLHEAYKNTRTGEPDLAFTSLLFAMLIPDTVIARWFDAFIRRTGVDIETGLRAINQYTASLHDWQIVLPVSRSIAIWPSMSVLFMFSEAQALASNTLLDVLHIMAACIYSTNSGQEKKLANWNFDRVQWSNSFLGFIAKVHPDKADMYGNLHASVFSVQPAPVDTDVPHEAPLRGPSTHIDSDRWTTEDALGYDAYAHAIYRFLVHEKTQPPLTISIQAPWGGGKTSLMRMIQKELDPEAVPGDRFAPPQEANRSGRLTVRKVLDEIRKWASGEQLHQPRVEDDTQRQRLTVWFNAWKYESVNQVWAGLADAIMQQISSRMPVAERELFWLQLQRRRVDVDKIRQKIHDLIIRRVWRFAVKVLPVALGVLAIGVSLAAGGVSFGWFLAGGAVPASMAVVVVKYLRTQKAVESEPADISLGEYVKAPDYSAELGFIHHAERDLQNVFKCIPEQYKPLVVFIDDLDRCSPGSVAKVMEAVNLFLAGEFPNCVFVLGMDSELVAAALQAAHSDMIAALDNRTKTPVGWRFMDKFIQLPFIIPPCESEGIDRYTTTLFSSHRQQTKGAGAQSVPHTETGEAETTSVGRQRGVVSSAQPAPEEARRAVRMMIDKGIREFSDDNPQIERYIAQGKAYFRGNPREMKRFANTFRFHYFLRWARAAQPGVESPTAEQVVRWTVLAMKWPEVARWLHSGSGAADTGADANGSNRSGVRSRLLRIAECARADTPELWKEHMQKHFLSDGGKAWHWLDDDDLFRFFKKDGELPEADRLSSGAGRGLW